MSSEGEKRKRMRASYFRGFCSETVVSFLVHDRNLSDQQKEVILKIAKHNVDAIGKFRIHWSDFQEAMKLYRDDLARERKKSGETQ